MATGGGYKCHFKDVCIAFTKKALERSDFIAEDEVDEFVEDEMLMGEW